MSNLLEPRAELMEQIVSSRFTITKFRTGYDLTQVDDFLDLIAVGLRDGTPDHDLIATILQTRFKATRWRDGYDTDQVDTFLDGVAHALKQIGSPAATGAASGETSDAPSVPAELDERLNPTP